MAASSKQRGGPTPVAPVRAKRKRTADDDGAAVNGHTTNKRQAVDKNGAKEAAAREAAKELALKEQREAEAAREAMKKRLVVDFNTFTISELLRYIQRHGLAPTISPSPLSTLRPPPTRYLLEPPPAVITAEPTLANRPQRASKRLQHNRASLGPKDTREPILPDLDGYKKALAALCQQHCQSKPAKEADVTMGFMYALKVKNRTLKIIQVEKALA